MYCLASLISGVRVKQIKYDEFRVNWIRLTRNGIELIKFLIFLPTSVITLVGHFYLFFFGKHFFRLVHILQIDRKAL